MKRTWGLAVLLAPAAAWAQEQSDGRSIEAVRPVVALVVLTGLAYVAGLPRWRQWERRLGLSQAVSAGLPFVALGFAARASGVLSSSLLDELGAVLRIALGWTGFLVGLRFRATTIERTSREVLVLAACRSVFSLGIVAGVMALLLGPLVASTAVSAPLRANQALMLGLAASVTSFVVPRLLSERGADVDTVSGIRRVVQLEELLALACLLVVSAYFRTPESGVWPLPGGAWVLLTLGLGAGAGLLANAVLGTSDLGEDERVLLSLGVVSFTAGAAGYLQLSPLVVGFLAGTALAALPGERELILMRTLAPLDHALTLVFLVFVGAYLDVRHEVGWLLAALFVAARLLGKLLGTLLGTRWAHLSYGGDASRALIASPLGSLGIAIVIQAHVLTPTGVMPMFALAVVVAAIVTELLVQVGLRTKAEPRPLAVTLKESR